MGNDRVIIDHEPENTLTHRHDGHDYTYALHDGQLVQKGIVPRSLPLAYSWRYAEVIRPQLEPEQDPDTGEWFGPDPDRESYITALRHVLETTERRPRAGDVSAQPIAAARS